MELIDIGVNLTNSRLYHDRHTLKTDALAVGVIHQIITGTSYEASLKAYEICQEDPSYYSSTAGCHPHDAKDLTSEHLDGLRELLSHDEVVAVGECGLDFNRNFSPPEIQKEVFQQQIDLALEVKKPLFLHQRDAHDAFLEQLKPVATDLSGICHCFTGNKDEMRDYLDLGFYIGITGWLCDERRGADLQNALKYAPLDRIMLETDAPYLIPRTIRPRPKSNLNTAANLTYVLDTAAEITGKTSAELAKVTTENCCRLFKVSR